MKPVAKKLEEIAGETGGNGAGLHRSRGRSHAAEAGRSSVARKSALRGREEEANDSSFSE